MKKILFVSIFLFFLGSIEVFSQRKAPNYFHADPQQYKHRLSKTLIYSYLETYEYDSNDRLVKKSTFGGDSESSPLLAEVKYYFNEDGYMIRSEESGFFGQSTEWVVGIKEEYTRDSDGYITSYKRYTSKEQAGVLEDDIRISFTYDDEKKLVEANIDFFVNENDAWEPLRKTELTYNEEGLLEEVMQSIPSGKMPTYYNRELLSYNEDGKIISIEFVPGVTEEQAAKWIFEYDADGDIIKAGREDFWFYYEYNKEMMASETFIPRPTIANMVYLGPKNDVNFAGLPHMNSYTHAVVKETESGSTYTYEAVMTGLEKVKEMNPSVLVYPSPADKFIMVEVAAEGIGQIATIADMRGQKVLSFKLTGSSQRVDVSALHGTYMLKVGNTVKKLIVK